MSDRHDVNAPCAEEWADRDERRRQIVHAQTAMLMRIAAGIEPMTSIHAVSLPVVGGALVIPDVDSAEYQRSHPQEPPPPPDLVNHPPHYTVGGIETIDFIEAKRLDYCSGQVVKYLARHLYKGNTLTDLRKAEWYLKRRIAQVEADEP